MICYFQLWAKYKIQWALGAVQRGYNAKHEWGQSEHFSTIYTILVSLVNSSVSQTMLLFKICQLAENITSDQGCDTDNLIS